MSLLRRKCCCEECAPVASGSFKFSAASLAQTFNISTLCGAATLCAPTTQPAFANTIDPVADGAAYHQWRGENANNTTSKQAFGVYFMPRNVYVFTKKNGGTAGDADCVWTLWIPAANQSSGFGPPCPVNSSFNMPAIWWGEKIGGNTPAGTYHALDTTWACYNDQFATFVLEPV